MALLEVHFNADNSLGKMVSATVIVPQNQPGPYSALYLLGGHSDDHSAWARRSNIERYVMALPLIVVMPNGERGWYVDSVGDPSKKFESYILDDLIPFVDSAFQTKPDRGHRAIAGLSMGGYGALRFAMKHPERFCAAHSFSGALWLTEYNPNTAEFHLVFGDKLNDSDFDLRTLAKGLTPSTMPRISFDCGVDDFMIESNRNFHRFLAAEGVPHDYVEYAGAHDWTYWNEHVLDALPPLLRALGIDRKIDRAAHLGR